MGCAAWVRVEINVACVAYKIGHELGSLAVRATSCSVLTAVG